MVSGYVQESMWKWSGPPWGASWQGSYTEAGVGEQPLGKLLTGHMVQADGSEV
jgi:hypothetical protein